MRFVILIKATKNCEAGIPPDDKTESGIAKYTEELANAGALLAVERLQPSSNGARVRYANGKLTVIDGPFAETKELVAGFFLIQARSRDEAIAWAKRVPAPHGPDEQCEIEVRQFFELEDFQPSEAVEHHKEVGKKLAASKKTGA